MAFELTGNVEVLRIIKLLVKNLALNDLQNYYLAIDSQGDNDTKRISLSALLAFAGGGTGSVSKNIDTAFNPVLDFTISDFTALIPDVQSGAITFTNGTPAIESFKYIYVTLSTDGSVINFPATFREVLNEYDSDSAQYGIIFYYDGNDYMYWLFKIKDIDITPPTLTTGIVEDASKAILNLGFSEAVNITTAGWTINTDGAALSITGVTDSGTSTPNFTLSRDILNGEVITLDYDSGTGATEDLEGNALVSFAGFSVTNNVAAGSQVAAMNIVPGSGANFVLTTGNDGAEAPSPTGGNSKAYSTQQANLSSDWEIQFDTPTLPNSGGNGDAFVSIGLSSSANVLDWLNMTYVFSFRANEGTLWTGTTRTLFNDSTISYNTAWKYRITYTNATDTLSMEYSTDGGSNWNVVQSFAYVSGSIGPSVRVEVGANLFAGASSSIVIDNIELFGSWP